jgi:anti-anti-sigma factor
VIEKATLFTFSTDLDFAHEAALREQLASLQPQELAVLNLSGVRFVDSTGLRLLLDFAQSVRPARVVVIGARPSIRQVFKIAGLESAFSFEEAR